MSDRSSDCLKWIRHSLLLSCVLLLFSSGVILYNPIGFLKSVTIVTDDQPIPPLSTKNHLSIEEIGKVGRKMRFYA